MKKIILLALIAITSSVVKAQDSCYVYTYLHWMGNGAKHQVQLTQDLEEEGRDFVSETGETLVFKNFMCALNYAVANENWEVFYVSTINPFNGYFKREQYAILRKCMSKNESATYRELEAEKPRKK